MAPGPSRLCPFRLQRVRTADGRTVSCNPGCIGGESGIRTHDPLAEIRAFQARLIGHSSISPRGIIYRAAGQVGNGRRAVARSANGPE